MSEQEENKAMEKPEQIESPSDDSSKDEESQKSTENQPSTQEIERIEEAKLKARYPKPMQPMSGHSDFLKKRLAKGQKYFDSGDYQMAKQKPLAKARNPPALPAFNAGDSIPTAIPTPESVPVRKTSIIQQPKLNFTNTTS